MRLSGVVIAALLTGSFCTPRSNADRKATDSAALAGREARLAESLAHPDTGKTKDAPVARWALPGDLAEISGLALTADGRLLVHDDELGRVAEIDYRKGVKIKEFFLGGGITHADFEGITVARDSIYLLASNGRLLAFREGANRQRVGYTIHDTKLGKECEFEGVAFDPAINSLLLACKTVLQKSLRGKLVIYRWKLDAGGGDRLSELAVPLARVIGSHPWKELHPTDITLDPSSGNYVLVASIEKALIELTPSGELVFARALHGRHHQAEGVAITRDGILLISDEAGKRQGAALTLYRWP